MTSKPAQSLTSRRLILIAIALATGAAAGLAGIYGIGGFQRNAGEDQVCRPSVAESRKILAGLNRGEVAAVTLADRPILHAGLTFKDRDGKERSLREWQGRVVLLNLWATWCVPCRKEMPALDALQARLGGPHFEVVTVNIDTRDPDKPRTWLKEIGVNALAYYSDHSARIFQDLKAVGRAFGMPTTILIDRAGCELASLAGPAEWASEDALRLVRSAIGVTEQR